MKQKGIFKWLIGSGVVLVAIAMISTLNFGDNIVYFYTPQEALAKSNELSENTIKVGGMVKGGSVNWQPDTLDLSFTLSDLKGSEIAIYHKGTPPDMFKENQGVVVEGRLDPTGSEMVSKRLMVKHSEEYKKPDDHSSMNKMLLEESIFKNENP